MLDESRGFLSKLVDQIPIVIALLLSFLLGNIQWSSTVNRGISEQTKMIQMITATLAEQTKTLEKITMSLSEITSTINTLKKGT